MFRSASFGPVRPIFRLVRPIAGGPGPRDGQEGSSKPPSRLDRSRVPTFDEADLEESFIKGSGPGGQSVNKTVNCCQLKHKPTGMVVKVHQTRSLDKNRQIARELLVEKLDDLYNGEMSVASQKKRIALYKLAVRESQAQRRRAMKEEFKRNQSDRMGRD